MTSGRRIGRYQVVEMVGAGAFATVYRALDERLDDTVAVKVLAENHSFTPELRERFLREGRVLRRIESPHVVTVHDLGETEDRQPFLVLDFADRGTLRQRTAGRRRQGWRASTADVLAVARPLAQALTAVHRVDVVHRDLNPGNVLLTTRGGHLVEAPEQAGDGGAGLLGHDERLVLADLGLCKDLALNSGHTSAGGTQGFQPPELRRGPAIIDGRADLWSLSALVVWLVTGEPPEGQDVDAAITAAGHPAVLAEALNRSLAESPDDRHPDAAVWWQEVAAALSASGTSGAPGAGVAAMSAGESVVAAPTQVGPGMVRPEWVPPDGPEPVSASLSESASQQPDTAGAVSAGPGPARPLHGLGQAEPVPHYGQAQGQSHPAPGLYDSAYAGYVGPMSVGAAGEAQTAGPEAHGYAHGHGGNIGQWGGSAWPPASASLPARDRSWGWLLRHSLWLLLTLLLGFLTWAGFLYVGLRANDRVWKMAAVGYAVGVAALLVLIMLIPVDADGNAVEGVWQETSALLLMVALWIGGFVHALFANVRWLRWRASQGR